MPQFPKRSTLPMRPNSYRAAARRLRRLADLIEARADPQTPHERGALTGAIASASYYARALYRRHYGIPIADPRRHRGEPA